MMNTNRRDLLKGLLAVPLFPGLEAAQKSGRKAAAPAKIRLHVVLHGLAAIQDNHSGLTIYLPSVHTYYSGSWQTEKQLPSSTLANPYNLAPNATGDSHNPPSAWSGSHARLPRAGTPDNSKIAAVLTLPYPLNKDVGFARVPKLPTSDFFCGSVGQQMRIPDLPTVYVLDYDIEPVVNTNLLDHINLHVVPGGPSTTSHFQTFAAMLGLGPGELCANPYPPGGNPYTIPDPSHPDLTNEEVLPTHKGGGTKNISPPDCDTKLLF